jgi:ubiquinone/menaquinone biosynthesis C-methylase UbiE
MSGSIGSAWLFNVGAEIYAGMNAQVAWARSCGRLAAHFPPGPAPLVLDLGCGPGFATLAMARARPEARLIGLDLAPRMLREAVRYLGRRLARPRLSLLRADAARLPFRVGSLDAVTGHSFLYLVDHPADVLAEARRVLRPGGRLILMEPNDRHVPPRQILRHSRDPRFIFSVALWRPYSRRHGRFTAETLATTLAAAGFDNFGSEEVLAGLGLIGWANRPADAVEAGRGD